MEEQRHDDPAVLSGTKAPVQKPAPATEAEIAAFATELINRHVEYEIGDVTVKGDKFWQALAEFVLEELNNVKDLYPVVDMKPSFRVKSIKSLQGKIERLQKAGQDNGKFQTMDSIREMRWDIAGTRMCLYFPCQLQQVKDFIEKNECFEVIPDTPRNKEKDTEPRSAKLFREREYSPRNQETRPYKERMGYYEADHYWIRLNKNHPRVSATIPNYVDEAIEIQIRTTLMDAWAEVRHDLEYKHILGYPSEAELRVLDAIKGTIASCEIMQDHLFMLREQRIKRDGEAFNFAEPDNYWKAIVNTLQPKHRLLLEEFGDGKPNLTEYLNTATHFLEWVDIRSPDELKKMVNLNETQEQIQAISRVREAFRFMENYSRSQDSPLVPAGGHAPPIRAEANLTLFRFIAIVLLRNKSVEEVQGRFYGHDYILIRNNGSAPGLWTTDRVQENRSNVQKCAARWYEMLSTVIKTLAAWLEYDETEDDLYTETISTTWHVHEWIATIYQDTMKLDQVMRVVSRLCSHYTSSDSDVWKQRASWLCAAVVFIQWENVGRPERFALHERWDASLEYSGVVLLPLEYESAAWHKGEQVAADIIRIEPSQLKHATLYRALCQGEDEYALHCLADADIDVNWQDRCGISLLGAAAAFGSPEVCNAMLARPEVDPNLAFPDGLSLIHIAVARRNQTMIELLTSKPNLNIEAIWVHNDQTYEQRALYWHQDTSGDGSNWSWENWDWAWDDWSEENDDYDDDNDNKFHQPSHSEKHSWTALEMARHRLSTCERKADRPKLLQVYKRLQKANTHPKTGELDKV